MTIDLSPERLNRAAADLRLLLERGYPRERSLRLVGDRHRLDAPGREILRRAVVAPRTAQARRAKLAGLEDLAGNRVGIDGHNVILTLETALSGRLLVLADDGAVRDISRSARSFKLSPLTDRALGLMLDILAEYGPAEVRVYLDGPVSHSGRLAAMIRGGLAERNLVGDAEAVAVPERLLKPFDGLVASADGELIDLCPRPIDLAGGMITSNYHREFTEAKIIGTQTG